MGDSEPNGDRKRDGYEGSDEGSADGCVRHGSTPYDNDARQDVAV